MPPQKIALPPSRPFSPSLVNFFIWLLCFPTVVHSHLLQHAVVVPPGCHRTAAAAAWQIHADEVMKDAFTVRLRRRELEDLEDEFLASEA
jgi:hypothetical protein